MTITTTKTDEKRYASNGIVAHVSHLSLLCGTSRQTLQRNRDQMRDTGKILLHCESMQVGELELTLEAPDLIVIQVRGSVTAADVELIAQMLKERGESGTAYILTILETAKFEGSPEARRHFADAIKGLSTIANAVIGANFRFRVILRFVENVARVMSNLTFRVAFYDDDTSARAWLRDQGCVACGGTARST